LAQVLASTIKSPTQRADFSSSAAMQLLPLIILYALEAGANGEMVGPRQCGVQADGRDVMLVQLSREMQKMSTHSQLVEVAPGEAYHLIQNRHGTCLEFLRKYSRALGRGGIVHMRTCDERNPEQQFTHDVKSGQIKNRNGECLEAKEGEINGGMVQMTWSCRCRKSKNMNQQWTFDAESGQIKNRAGVCLDSPEGNHDNGNVLMRACDKTKPNQRWHLGYQKPASQPTEQPPASQPTEQPPASQPTAQPPASQLDSFEAIDGGIQRACRGASRGDNSPSYYSLHKKTASLADCKVHCMNAAVCKGIEYNSKKRRCEVWSREVGATISAKRFHCLAYKPAPALRKEFEPVDGGADRVCRGITSSDSSFRYYVLHKRIKTLENCKMLCAHTAACTGVEYSPRGRCEVWTQPIHASAHRNGFLCFRTKHCHTAEDGDACYAKVMWAMASGVFQHYNGLSNKTDGFEAFQMAVHNKKRYKGLCPRPCDAEAAPPVGPTTMTTTATPASLASACNAVLSAVAQDPWSSSTCGQRISWLQSPAGDSKTEEQAQAQIALEYTACEPCWPWEKYKAPGDTTRSPKRGIAIQNHKLKAALGNIAGMVSWGYSWTWSADTAWPAGGPGLMEWDQSDVHYLPMVWSERNMEAAEKEFVAGREALLGFNEPNFHDQANMSPERAAALWPRLERLATRLGVDKLVSPALNFNTYHPADWLGRFFEVCSGCRVDAIALHSYTCHGKYLKDHLDIYRVFGKPLWLTEFACSERGSEDRRSMEGQMAYMREAVPMLERDPDVEMYAWFSYFEDEWDYSIFEDGKNGDAGLVNADGSLSQLGQLYASFAAAEPIPSSPGLTPTPAPMPAPTPAPTQLPVPCHTAQRGEPCYEGVRWAMSDGIRLHPEWYPGLSSSSRFELFQAQLHASNHHGCPMPCE